MTVRELINELLNMPMDAEVSISVDEEHLDEHGEQCAGYVFDLKEINKYDNRVEITFDDWRLPSMQLLTDAQKQEIIRLYLGMSPSMQKAVIDVMTVTQKDKYVPKGDQK